MTIATLAPTFIAALLSLLAPLAASAQDDVASFYKGKTVTVQVGSDAGGQYDAIARTVARHMGRHIPGQPAMVDPTPRACPGRCRLWPGSACRA